MPDEETIDIVDENDVVLYQTTRGEAHAEGLLHRCVLAQLINSKGEWILVKQAADRQDAGQYVMPMGGHVNARESVEDALFREVLEELGLEEFEYNFVGKLIYRRSVLGRHENHLFIFHEILSDIEPVLGDEAVEHKKFTREELRTALDSNPKWFGDVLFAQMKAFYPDMLP